MPNFFPAVGRKSHEKGTQLFVELCVRKGKFSRHKVGCSGAQLPLNTRNQPLAVQTNNITLCQRMTGIQQNRLTYCEFSSKISQANPMNLQ
jgi:hypothetical protein